MLGLRGAGVVPGDRVVGEAAQQVDVAGGPGVLEAADPQVAARDPGEHGSRQQGLAAHRAPGRHHGEGAGRGDAEGVHRLADDVLAQHRADRGQAVAAARERRAPGALEVQVAKVAVGVDELAEQQRAPVAQTRGEPAELVPGVGLRHRGGAAGDEVADQQPQAVGAAQPGRVEAELGGQRLVEHEQPRVGSLLGLPGNGHLRKLAGEAVVEGDGRMAVRCSRHRDYVARRHRPAASAPSIRGDQRSRLPSVAAGALRALRGWKRVRPPGWKPPPPRPMFEEKVAREVGSVNTH